MAKPKLALIPCTQGYFLNSVLPSDGSGDFRFSRSGTATRINSQGLIEEVGDGVSRLNYPMIDGVVKGCPHHILEPQRINLLPYSQDFSNAAWSKSNVTIISNSIISPDGSLNANELQVTSSGGNIYDNVGGSGDGVFSVFAKYKDVQYIRLRSTGSYAFFDIKNGVLGSTINTIDTKIEKYPNGWYKCSVIGNNTNSLAQIFVSSDNVNVGLGNVYLWGADFQNGSYPTSYIPTNGTTVTRQAETANDSGDAATFNDSEGVLMAEVSALVNNGESRRISISHSADDTSNRITLEVDETTSTIKAFMSSGNVTVGSITVNNINQTNNNKIALLYKENTFEMHINGFLLGSDYTIASLPIELSRLQLEGANGSNDFYGKTKQVQYYNSALTESELSQLTSWTSFTDMAEGQLYTIE